MRPWAEIVKSGMDVGEKARMLRGRREAIDANVRAAAVSLLMEERGAMKARWWAVDTSFVATLGGMVAPFFGTSFFARGAERPGSSLIPASTLQKLIEQGQRCQTVTHDHITNPTPAHPC